MSRTPPTLRLCAICLFAAAATAATSLAADDPPAKEAERRAAEAGAAVAAFASALKSELTAAMQAGGPVHAIEVCHTRAPAIAGEVSLQQDFRIARVSQRNRNPHNYPNAWQRGVLESFEAQLNAGADPAALTWNTIAETAAGREFRFMQAIPTQPLCLACHGETLAPEVAARIAERYPEDRATGFRAGDLRGAFVVTRPLD